MYMLITLTLTNAQITLYNVVLRSTQKVEPRTLKSDKSLKQHSDSRVCVCSINSKIE